MNASSVTRVRSGSSGDGLKKQKTGEYSTISRLLVWIVIESYFPILFISYTAAVRRLSEHVFSGLKYLSNFGSLLECNIYYQGLHSKYIFTV